LNSTLAGSVKDQLSGEGGGTRDVGKKKKGEEKKKKGFIKTNMLIPHSLWLRFGA